MATPDYLQQVVVSGRRHGSGRANSARQGLFRRPSVTSLVWGSLDLVTIAVAAVLAVRLRMVATPGVHEYSMIPTIFRTTPREWLLYLLWYGGALVVITRSFGLYGSIQNRSGLHEQRMTFQATLTAGLLLCGLLYLRQAIDVSRIVVLLLVVITAVLLSVRRGAVAGRGGYPPPRGWAGVGSGGLW